MKKLTYFVSAMLAVSAVGATFTSCVDNDEPYGVQVLRESKADLLKAKQALYAAQAQKAIADAEVAKIDAETRRIQAEIDKLRAEAEIAMEQAESAAKVRLIEAQIAQLQQETAAMIKKAEEEIKKLQAEAAQAQLEYQKALLTMSEQEQDYLNRYYEKYFAQLDKYNAAYESYLKAQQDLAEAQLDINGNNFGTIQSKKNDYDQAVRDLATAQETLAEFTERKNEISALKPSELGAKYTEYKEELDKINYDIEKANVERAALAVSNAETYDSLNVIVPEKIKKIGDEKIVVEPYTFTPQEPITQIPGFDHEIVMIPGGQNYTLNNAGLYNFLIQTNNDYMSVALPDGTVETIQPLGYWMKQIKATAMNDNDRAWTQAILGQMKADLVEAQKPIEAAQKNWSTAAEAFGAPANAGTLDPSKLIGYDKLEEAVGVFNTFVGKYNPLQEAEAKALEAWEKSQKDLEETFKTVDPANPDNKFFAAYNEAVKTATATRDAAKKAATEKRDSDIKALEAATKSAKDNLTALTAAYEKAQKELDAAIANPAGKDIVALTNKAEEAKRQAEIAQTAYDNTVSAENNGKTLAIQQYDAAIASADTAYNAAVTKAQETRDKNLAGYEKDPEYVKAIKAEKDASAAYDKAQENVATLMREYEVHPWMQVQAALEKIGEQYAYTTGLYTGYLAVDAEIAKAEDEGKPYETITAAQVAPFNDFASMKGLVEQTSYTIFGSFAQNRPIIRDNVYALLNLPYQQLINLDLEAVNKMIAEVYPDMAAYQYHTLYDSFNFGMFGELLKTQYNIACAEAYLGNATAVNGAIEAISAQYDALVAANKAQKQLLAAANEELEKTQAHWIAITKDVDDEIAALTAKQGVYSGIVSAIETAVMNINGGYIDLTIGSIGDKTIEFTQAMIDATIEGLEDQIEQQELTVKEKEQQVELKKHIMDAYAQNDFYSAAKLDVESAKLTLDKEKALLDVLKQQLDIAIAFVSGEK